MPLRGEGIPIFSGNSSFIISSSFITSLVPSITVGSSIFSFLQPVDNSAIKIVIKIIFALSFNIFPPYPMI